jgi:uncharacterized membrane protein YgcG
MLYRHPEYLVYPHGQYWGHTILTKRALGEAPGSPRETESGRSAAGGSQRLLSKNAGSEGADGTSERRHFGGIEVIEGGEREKWEGRV